MGKNDRDEVARRELAHALDALLDGAGREKWGPGVVGERLYWRSRPAAIAFDAASAVIMRVHDDVGAWETFAPSIFAEHLRALAPVLLETVLAAEQLPSSFASKLVAAIRETVAPQ